ncbi:MAG: PA0069 family radical SAM protein [Gammaproteobacteria bacterium]|nr:PA0069 family radical SAM protein [Gammaproteobacteria bacterium]
MAEHDSHHRKGRGATLNPSSRFDTRHTEIERSDELAEEFPESIATELRVETARSIITRNDSPDVPFSQSINMYRGCEHGCIYCYARPAHAYVDLSPGVDFETILFHKPNAPELLREALAKPGYRPSTINLGSNTDPYQPIEREQQLTRRILEVLREARHPVSIITKGSLVLRDADILAEMAADDLASVAVSLTTLDNDLKRKLEPRTASGRQRLAVMRELSDAGIPVTTLVAPVIPAINDHELESLVAAAAEHGARRAAYIFLRLPYEVAPLFRDWLATHYPDRAAHVMSLVNQLRGGKDNSAEFGKRMRGEGAFAELLSKRFRLACKRHGLNIGEVTPLDTSKFRPPGRGGQQSLF